MLPVYTISICLKSFLLFQSRKYKKEYKKCYTILTENLVLEINVVSEPEVFLITHIITTAFQIIFIFILISCFTCYLFFLFLFLSFTISFVDAGGRSSHQILYLVTHTYHSKTTVHILICEAKQSYKII